jgi:hypothetical protein
MTRDDYQLIDNDHAALQLALDLTLADDPVDEGRIEQVQSMLADREWLEVATFTAYHQQMARLNLHVAARPPCWIVTDEEADLILRVGPRLAMDGSGRDISNCKPARLLKRMLRHGISPYHPNPIAALKEAQREKRRK